MAKIVHKCPHRSVYLSHDFGEYCRKLTTEYTAFYISVRLGLIQSCDDPFNAPFPFGINKLDSGSSSFRGLSCKL